jgi:F-type H+-transporting ATPase subunit b
MNVTRQDIAVIVTNIIGFLIVLWILRRFAWGPLLSFIEERRRRISEEFASIDKQRSEVSRLRDEFSSKLKEIESLKRASIQEGAAEGQKLADSIKTDARREAQDIRDRARDEARREVDKARIELRDSIVEMTVRAAEKIMLERLDGAKHRELIARSIDQMGKA